MIGLRMDDVGAASKRFEVYGVTRLPVGRFRVPFPGNLLFLKYVPPVKRWGPYRELGADDWERILQILADARARMTVAVTAGWVEFGGSVVPYPRKFPEAAAVVREGVERGILEIANHGYTHCVLQDRLFRPRALWGNRTFHREFYDWLPAATHREHIRRSQSILQEFFACRVTTFVPPGGVFSRVTLAAAADVGIRRVSCLNADGWSATEGLMFVNDADLTVLHDRDVVIGGLKRLQRILGVGTAGQFVTVADLAADIAATR